MKMCVTNFSYKLANNHVFLCYITCTYLRTVYILSLNYITSSQVLEQYGSVAVICCSINAFLHCCNSKPSAVPWNLMKPAAESDKPRGVSWNHTVYRVKKKFELLVINRNCLHQERPIYYSHSNVAKDSCLLGCHMVSVGKCWLMFWRITVPYLQGQHLSWTAGSRRWRHCSSSVCQGGLPTAQWHSVTSQTTWIFEANTVCGITVLKQCYNNKLWQPISDAWY